MPEPTVGGKPTIESTEHVVRRFLNASEGEQGRTHEVAGQQIHSVQTETETSSSYHNDISRQRMVAMGAIPFGPTTDGIRRGCVHRNLSLRRWYSCLVQDPTKPIPCDCPRPTTPDRPALPPTKPTASRPSQPLRVKGIHTEPIIHILRLGFRVLATGLRVSPRPGALDRGMRTTMVLIGVPGVGVASRG